MPSNKHLKESSTKRLAERTVQIIGFTFAVFLTLAKLTTAYNGRDLGIDWWVIFGFIGVGISAKVNINDLFGRK